MARYDKYDPKVGGFRGALAADWLPADIDKMVGVGLNATGEIVKGGGTTGVIGVLILTKARKAGEIVDTMTAGEIVEVAGTAGRVYASNAAGVVAVVATPSVAAPAGGARIGHTVEGDRLVVRVVPVAQA